LQIPNINLHTYLCCKYVSCVWWWPIRRAETCSSTDKLNKGLLCSTTLNIVIRESYVHAVCTACRCN